MSLATLTLYTPAIVTFFSVVGKDETARFVQQQLGLNRVQAYLYEDDSRPTILKQRFRTQGKTLLRVNHLRSHAIDQEIQAKIFRDFQTLMDKVDLVIFSDFNYGCLPQPLVDNIVAECLQRQVMMVADSQCSSQVGDVSRFKEMTLLTPTEREARISVRDFESGLVVLAESLRCQAQSHHLLLTLASEGVLIHGYVSETHQYLTDRLPAFNTAPKDVAGAGDTLLVCTAMSLALGKSIWQSAYLGSLAAACQVGRVGNIPLNPEDFYREISQCKALLLAAGLGTRLRPLTDNLPKCLVPIQGKPLLAYWLEMLTQAQVSPLLLNLHYKAEAVRDFISHSPYTEVVTCVYEETLLGTAGTLRKNQAFFENEPLMLIHADNLSKFAVRAFIDRHHNRPAGCEITMMTFICPTPQSCGIVELDGRGVVQAFHEKVANPPGNLANGAVYIITPTIFEFLNRFDQAVIDFSTQVLPYYLGKIYTFHNDEYHRDIGTWESYQAALEDFAK